MVFIIRMLLEPHISRAEWERGFHTNTVAYHLLLYARIQMLPWSILYCHRPLIFPTDWLLLSAVSRDWCCVNRHGKSTRAYMWRHSNTITSCFQCIISMTYKKVIMIRRSEYVNGKSTKFITHALYGNFFHSSSFLYKFFCLLYKKTSLFSAYTNNTENVM